MISRKEFIFVKNAEMKKNKVIKMYCNNCKKSFINNSYKYCPICGNRLGLFKVNCKTCSNSNKPRDYCNNCLSKNNFELSKILTLEFQNMM